MNDLKDWFSRRRQAVAPKSTLTTRTAHPWRDDPTREPDNPESFSGPPSSTADRGPLGSRLYRGLPISRSRVRERKDLCGDLCRDDLWGLAYRQLVEEHESLVKGYEEVLRLTPSLYDNSPADIQERIQSVLALKRKQILQKQWRLKWGNKSIKVRAQIDSIVKIISAFKDVGNVVANVDPLHAGLPWAGICFLLAVST